MTTVNPFQNIDAYIASANQSGFQFNPGNHQAAVQGLMNLQNDTVRNRVDLERDTPTSGGLNFQAAGMGALGLVTTVFAILCIVGVVAVTNGAALAILFGGLALMWAARNTADRYGKQDNLRNIVSNELKTVSENHVERMRKLFAIQFQNAGRSQAPAVGAALVPGATARWQPNQTLLNRAS